MTRRIGKSDAQANAEALVKRERTYSAASDASFKVSWDWHNREPKDLRECVRMVRAAYADEVPTKLHEHQIGEGGTPKMTDAAVRYFDAPKAGDREKVYCTCRRLTKKNADSPHDDDCATKAPPPLVSHYLTPFRAALERQGKTPRRRLVWLVAASGIGPVDAAQAVGVPVWCAKIVAEDVLRSFLRSMTDLKLDLHKEPEAA